ncbi:uncharacterized protein DNG_05974 [Cephalotrichum gorgonifer]|uniref:Uncharacterized protein n=1 Tax=Cephalotrichum gorgonifer TaxID=2041049 RepID=A0AAE8MZ78_9PEZI|nr:uncharacterized protein DNG_05974 [Cephalotrichum gorgonifer]
MLFPNLLEGCGSYEACGPASKFEIDIAELVTNKALTPAVDLMCLEEWNKANTENGTTNKKAR